jgi:hypothetical protein
MDPVKEANRCFGRSCTIVREGVIAA